MRQVQIIIFSLLFILAPCCAFADKETASSDENDGSAFSRGQGELFLGMIIGDNDQTMPFFLNSIKKLDYDKNLIHLQINLCNSTESVRKLLRDWVADHKSHYREIVLIDSASLLKGKENHVDRNKVMARIKDRYLIECKNRNCGHCFIVSSDAFLAPKVLRCLIEQEKPIIAPLLRPVPEPNDPYRNFFGDVNPWGYYQHHPDYTAIANRQKIGTFQVPCVHKAYLIQSAYLDQLSFSDNFWDYEFISFSNNARDRNVGQYICNEREFGFQLHLKGGTTKEEERAFTLAGADREVNAAVLDSIFSPYYAEDPYLKAYVEQFNFDDYLIYRVHNKDLYYIDEVNDYIKNYIIKQGLNFEEHIRAQIQKYAKPGSVLIDIGGHMGTHSLALSRIVGDKGMVHVFEPQAKMFCELAINMHLNGCNNLTLHHNALGAEEKWIGMHIPKEAWLERFGSDMVNEGHGTVSLNAENGGGDRAKLVRLDDFHLEGVSFIKMDVEGFEMEVIKGGLETIKRNMPVMVIEIFKGPERQKKIQAIEDLGYIHENLYEDDYLFIPLSRLEEYVEADKESALSAVWEGSFMDLGSLSYVNRSLTEQLGKMHQIKLTSVGPNVLSGESAHLPELQEMSRRLSQKAPFDTQITVRHAWPPNWQAPPSGKWVLIQPWEFGALPDEWVKKMHHVDEVWVPTHFVKREYIESGVPEEKVVVIPNGIDPEIFSPEAPPLKLATNKSFKFLFLGGTIYRKGPDILLKSYLETFTSADDVCLVIKDFGGIGPYAGQTHHQQIKAAQQTPGAPEILYLDEELSSNEIASLYTACNCLVYPYRGEGFALPVLEAMACGLPVVVTAGGATDDFVTEEFGWFIPSTVRSIGDKIGKIKLIKEGWLLEPDAEALSMQMRWLSKHPAEGQAKGVAASRYARANWTWEKAASLVADRLRDLTAKK